MRTQACVPCAKRKVRCDREEPCSNCKRRTQDRCTYADISPAERIHRLEALVRSLGGSPADIDAVPDPNTDMLLDSKSDLISTNSAERKPSVWTEGDPAIVKEGGESSYIESFVPRCGRSFALTICFRSLWHQLNGKTPAGHSVLATLVMGNPSIQLGLHHPKPSEAQILWAIFHRNVNPLLKINFDAELESICKAALQPELCARFSGPEHALVFAMYLISVGSVSEQECYDRTGSTRLELLSRYQILCEQALAYSNFLGSSDFVILQAMTIYMYSGLDRFSTKTLWAMMGLVLRNAERLGLHRDGEILGIPPYETERRRRLWWKLQHIDLALALRSGSTSLSLTAEWDTKLPLNIEDSDIEPVTETPPVERNGITSFSYCLCIYWTIMKQRGACLAGDRLSWLSWTTAKSWSQERKESLIKELEDGLNKKFIQYCDPVQPLDTLIQLTSRALICRMSHFALNPEFTNGDLASKSESQRKRILQACMQYIQYDVAMHSNPLIKDFEWLTRSFFSLSAYLGVIAALCQQFDSPQPEVWDLLNKLYYHNSGLYEFSLDHRKLHVAEALVGTWKARERALLKKQQRIPDPPAFIKDLDAALRGHRAWLAAIGNNDGYANTDGLNVTANGGVQSRPEANSQNEYSSIGQFNTHSSDDNGIPELNLGDFDGLFWDSSGWNTDRP